MSQSAADEDPKLTRVVEAVRSGRRYRSVTDQAVRRLARAALSVEGGDVTRATKRTKRGLHEVFGAFMPMTPKYEALLHAVREAVALDDAEAIRAALKPALGAHSSTRERLPILTELYAGIFDRLDTAPATVRDLACGMNPLTVPWMPLPAGTTYVASDIDHRLMGFVGTVLGTLGVGNRVEVRDLLTEPDPEPADVTFLFKAVPCLEAQGKGLGWKLLDQINSPVLVVSFPTKTLGRHSRGMYRTHSAEFARRIAERPWKCDEIEFGDELVYVVTKD
ncbi:hypothetical protein [Streptomyces sp. NPDC087300]|uniref:hypothetical protein n=1 Tax=Streptomyces sp. NPDC087300 TaxID=3365780 RepID=UPI0038120BC7